MAWQQIDTFKFLHLFLEKAFAHQLFFSAAFMLVLGSFYFQTRHAMFCSHIFANSSFCCSCVQLVWSFVAVFFRPSTAHAETSVPLATKRATSCKTMQNSVSWLPSFLFRPDLMKPLTIFNSRKNWCHFLTGWHSICELDKRVSWSCSLTCVQNIPATQFGILSSKFPRMTDHINSLYVDLSWSLRDYNCPHRNCLRTVQFEPVSSLRTTKSQ